VAELKRFYYLRALGNTGCLLIGYIQITGGKSIAGCLNS
jgi:hypothetical protein